MMAVALWNFPSKASRKAFTVVGKVSRMIGVTSHPWAALRATGSSKVGIESLGVLCWGGGFSRLEEKFEGASESFVVFGVIEPWDVSGFKHLPS